MVTPTRRDGVTCLVCGWHTDWLETPGATVDAVLLHDCRPPALLAPDTWKAMAWIVLTMALVIAAAVYSLVVPLP